MLRFLILLIAFLLISACQHKAVVDSEQSSQAWLSDTAYFDSKSAAIAKRDSWRYAAKVGVTTPSQREQANLVWQRNPADNGKRLNEVRLFGPLGVGAVRLNFDDSGAVLYDQKGVEHYGQTAEQLLTGIVGWPIPIDALSSWLFAVPFGSVSYRYQLDQDGNLAVLEQYGWRIEYSTYRDYDGLLMARKIVASRELLQPNSQELATISVKLIAKSLK